MRRKKQLVWAGSDTSRKTHLAEVDLVKTLCGRVKTPIRILEDIPYQVDVCFSCLNLAQAAVPPMRMGRGPKRPRNTDQHGQTFPMAALGGRA